MHRVLLAATAAVALTAAASPAFAFNLAIVGQFGAFNGGTSYQVDGAGDPSGPGKNGNDANGNTLLGLQVGAGNYINNGACYGKNCKHVNEPGQTSDKDSNNFAGIGQFGAFNYASNHQSATNKGLNVNLVGQFGFGNSDHTRQDADGKGSTDTSFVVQGGLGNHASTDQAAKDGNTNSAAQVQFGAFNSSSVTQDTGGKKGGDNEAGVLQIGPGNHSSVTQTGGDNWAAVGQVGVGNSFTLTQSTTSGGPQG